MKIEKITHLLNHPNETSAAELSDLQSLISDYPYFQAIKAIQLKALKLNNSFLYNQKLKETAAYTTDRDVLFHFITSPSFTSPKKVAEETTAVSIEENKIVATEKKETVVFNNKGAAPTNIDLQSTSIEYKKEKEDSNTSINIQPNAPLEFPANETHSFSEWLKLTSIQPIVREETKSKKKKLIESPLIDRFLKTNPKIKPAKKSSPTVNLAPLQSVESENLMTETLAKVYIAQKNYKKAIQAYKILSLKNPEKSGLFADQIRAIKKLQDNNQ